MYIGYMGSIVFITSSHYMLTPSNMQQEMKGRWSDHDIVYKKPSSEFLGPGLRTVSFDIILSSMYNISPESQIDSLQEMCETGAVFPLTIGGKPVTHNYWRLDSMSVGDTYYGSTGGLQWAKVNVKLTEYDDSNYTEEKSLIDLYGSAANMVVSLAKGGIGSLVKGMVQSSAKSALKNIANNSKVGGALNKVASAASKLKGGL